jgi:hypothetical protein
MISDSLKNLSKLNISQTQMATYSSISHLFKVSGQNLVELGMSQSPLLGEQDWIGIIKGICETCPRLLKIDFSYNCLVTDEALDCLTFKSERMTLNLKYCDQLSKRAVHDLMEKCSPRLMIYHNARIPDYTPQGIRDYIKYLVGQ